VLNILTNIRQPCVNGIMIDWHNEQIYENNNNRFIQAPSRIHSLFNGMRLTVYGFIDNCFKATLRANINGQELATTVFTNKMTETTGRVLHCLTARAIIDDWENGLLSMNEAVNEQLKFQYKQHIIDLSIKYSIVSPFTSFVAIEERSKDDTQMQQGIRLLDIMLEKNRELLPYIGWDGDNSQSIIMKQKLIDMKSLIDASSILSKATLCDELFTLCKDVSYRQFGEKFDAMLTIIDTYYYVLKDYPKAFELLNEMKSAVKEEMNFATWDEKTEMKSRMHLFSHIIDETETSQDDHQLEFLSDCISEKLSMQTCKIDCFKDELWRSEDDSVDIQFQADSEKDTE
ncbi:unnamed protein product, partial [Didymodactylos carnosus]